MNWINIINKVPIKPIMAAILAFILNLKEVTRNINAKLILRPTVKYKRARTIKTDNKSSQYLFTMKLSTNTIFFQSFNEADLI